MDAIIRINKIFSEAVFTKYKSKKYGFKNCSVVIDAELADDLRNLLTRIREMEDCSCILPGICSLSKIEEKINTL